MITEYSVKRLQISELKDLDPIDVYMEDFAHGKGQITVTCYGCAWTSYFGAMGCTIREFVTKSGIDYLVNKLTDYGLHKATVKNQKYLGRIVKAIQEALNEQKEG